MADDVIVEFLVESNENLDLLDRELVQLEKEPSNRNTLASVFRTIHTIKGTCGFLGFTKLESVAHVGENLLSKLRDGEIALTPEIATALLKMVDAIRQMLQSIESIGNEGERDDTALIQTLTHLQRSGASAESVSQKPAPANGARSEIQATEEAPLAPLGVLTAPKSFETVKPPSQEPQAARAEAPSPEAGVDNHPPQAGGGFSDASIRVDVGLLDKLMNLVGELVLARNQILQFSNTTEDSALLATSQRLNLITTELQEGVMKTRMQPIGNIWSKFPRTVRDVAATCGKQIRIEMEGKETELDKTIIEAIKDPLTHIVRNSADHGIEKPERRTAIGKPAEGRLLLRAFHEGGQVNIEISDDGAGLDGEKIRKKALEKGLITQEQASRLTDREAVNLIFLPGFSTAEKVTNVSGRGVGMDVVKTNIEKIGGTVDVETKAGSGTTVKMKIPLTLAIIPGLVVRASDKRFVIPQVSLIELVRIEGDQAKTEIETVHGVPVYRLRGRLLPLVHLHLELKLEQASQTEIVQSDAVNIVVLQADGRQFGLIVDEIKDTEEIVVKPLDRRLKNIKTFAGATIMGDGKVALILDVPGLAQRAGMISKSQDKAAATADAEVREKYGEKQTFLLFAGPDEARMALPLGELARLEEFPQSQIEKSGSELVIQYRGAILPLIDLNGVLEERRQKRRHLKGEEDAGGASPVQVLVCNHQDRTVGLLVEQILDIVEDRAVVRSPATRAGVLYATVIESRVTELLDLDAVLRFTEKARETSLKQEEEPMKVGD